MKPRKRATALKYDIKETNAPQLVAKGQGLIADKIEKIAREHGVEVREDRDLVEVLYTLDLYEEIPEELYLAVASILTEVYKINKKTLPKS